MSDANSPGAAIFVFDLTGKGSDVPMASDAKQKTDSFVARANDLARSGPLSAANITALATQAVKISKEILARPEPVHGSNAAAFEALIKAGLQIARLPELRANQDALKAAGRICTAYVHDGKFGPDDNGKTAAHYCLHTMFRSPGKDLIDVTDLVTIRARCGCNYESWNALTRSTQDESLHAIRTFARGLEPAEKDAFKEELVKTLVQRIAFDRAFAKKAEANFARATADAVLVSEIIDVVNSL